MVSLFKQIGDFLIGEEELSHEDKLKIQRDLLKRQLQAKDTRKLLLDDLEHRIYILNQYIKSLKQSKDLNDNHDLERMDTQSIIMESIEDQKNYVLNDEFSIVNDLCNSLDRCMNHGLRLMENNENETVKFFGVVKWTSYRVQGIQQAEMISTMQQASKQHGETNATVCELVTSIVQPKIPHNIRGFFGALRAANSLVLVKTDEGKARAFYRQALNMHVLQTSMHLILCESNMDLLSSYYTDMALFRQRDEVKMFLHLIEMIDQLPFAFLIDDERLDLSIESKPFLRPRPALKPKKVRKQKPKLIEPEDMVSGRVRLCKEDNETSLVAEKLVAHHHLGNAFNTLKGGNPLTRVLQETAQSEKIDDISVSVLRFLELGYPEYDVYGTNLSEVLCNPFLSGMARFEPHLGVPDVVESCFGCIYDNIDSPGLFQVHLPAEHVMQLRDTIEEMGGFYQHLAVDVHEAIAILYQYLWELPDCAFTEERLDSFCACGVSNLEMDEKAMLMKVLVNDLPWYSKPLLERLSHLIYTALLPVHAEKNGLTLYAVSTCFAPLLLRKAHITRFSEYDEASYRKYPIGIHSPIGCVRERLLYNESCGYSETRNANKSKKITEASQILQLIFNQQYEIFADVRQDLAERREALHQKVLRMEQLRFRMEEPVDIKNRSHVVLLKQLWDLLLNQDDDIDPVMTDDKDIDIQAILQSKRWKASGFHTENPLGGFRGGGVLGLELLIYFLREYPKKSQVMMQQNAEPGGNRYPFPVACINVMRMMMKLLMLDEIPDVCSKLVLHSAVDHMPPTILKLRIAERVSRTPFWKLFDDKNAFFKLHSMAFMLLDLHWIHSGATQMGFQPVLDATRRQMGWLLQQCPISVEDMWTTWMNVRQKDAIKNSHHLMNTKDMTAWHTLHSNAMNEVVETISASIKPMNLNSTQGDCTNVTAQERESEKTENSNIHIASAF